MNAAGATAERVYEALKALVLRGAFRPGSRLDPAVLADQLASSVTPVRASLNMLVGEGLAETGTGEGFHVPLLDEPALRDRYAWNQEILGIALRKGQAPETSLASEEGNTPTRTAALFLAIIQGSGNAEHGRAMASTNDRLHAVRVAEAGVLEQIDAELDDIADAAVRRDAARLRQLLTRYHRRRIRASAAVLRQLYRMVEAPPE